MPRYYSLEKSEKTADLYIFGDIENGENTGLEEWLEMDTGAVSGNSLVKELNALGGVEEIRVHINSLGGYTGDGMAIYNTLKNHPAKVVTIADGFAASAASLVFMAGNERLMNEASALMIHNAWSEATGNAAQMRLAASKLEEISKAAGNAYAERVSLSREELDAMLDGVDHEGTWILPADAVRMGFATGMVKPAQGAPARSCLRKVMQSLRGPAEPAAPAAPTAREIAEQVVMKMKELRENEPEKPAEDVWPSVENSAPVNKIKLFLDALCGAESEEKNA